MTALAGPALKAVQDGRIKIIPERFSQVYYHWMENIRDWNISRQLWWGHRIPAWYCDDCGEMTVTSEEKPTTCPKCASAHIHQDPDVLDTWFSSALWPFSTLGWPEQTEDFKRFYPTSVLETGYDIIFFWVARMIMMGLECTGDIPFDTVYLHGMIRDEHGEKMSKTKGNVVNPLALMDKYGTDALRFTLATGTTPGNDMKLSMTRVESSRNFANKIWNAARFIKQQTGPQTAAQLPLTAAAIAKLPLADRWILSRYNRLCRSVNDLNSSYQFGEAARQIEDFLWGEFCDWYIEMCKIRLYSLDPEKGTVSFGDGKQGERLSDGSVPAWYKQGAGGQGNVSPLPVLLHVLEGTLRLLHPFMPFVTEEIWQQLKSAWGKKPYEALIIAPYPIAADALIDDQAEQQMALLTDIVRSIRNARTEFGIDPARQIQAMISAGRDYDLLSDQSAILVSLARLSSSRLTIQREIVAKPKQALSVVSGGVEIFMPLSGLVDLTDESRRLANEIQSTEKEIARTQDLLANEGFTAKAPANVVERERQKLADARGRLVKLQERLRVVSE